MRLAIVLLLVTAPLHAGTRRRAVEVDASALARARSVLFIAAHPDDEVPIAPWLWKKCVEEEARCSFLVVTTGENGDCLLPGGCGTALGAIRAAEMTRSAAQFRGALTMWGFPDGAPEEWTSIGDRVRAHVEAVNPDVVVTFDPRHGTTGHPDHRAIGRIVIDAIGDTRELYLMETRIDIALDPLSIVFHAAEVDARVIERFDAVSRWDALLRTMEIHRSQFDERWIAAVAASPLRAVFFASYP